MPIQFRCTHCNQRLSVTRRKAGAEVACPSCAKQVRVPTLDEARSAAAGRGPASAEPQAEVTATSRASAAAAVAERDDSDVAGRLETPGHEADAGDSPEFASEAKSEPLSKEVVELWRRQTAEVDPWQADEDDEDDDFKLGGRDLEEAAMDMTPMVDVTFLLLIFFMITAAFNLQKSMPTTPPEPDEDGAAQTVSTQDIVESSVIVEIDASDNIKVDDDPVASLGMLVDVLTSKMTAESPPRNEMLIRADYRATHGIVVAVADAGMEANMQHIRRESLNREE
jgi:biopolymer transport protein ExbD